MDSTGSRFDGIVTNKILRELFISTAREGKIPYQISVNPYAGVSDAAAVHIVGEGVPTCDILVLRRYSHTPIEIVSLDDVENAIRLLCETLKRIDSKFPFSRHNIG